MKIHRSLKKISAIAASFLIAMSTCTTVAIHASNISVDHKTGYILKGGPNNTSGAMEPFNVDGHIGFCIEPSVGANFSTEDPYTGTSASSYRGTYTQAQITRITELTYFGYDETGNKNGRTGDAWFAATQLAIWQYSDSLVGNVQDLVNNRVWYDPQNRSASELDNLSGDTANGILDVDGVVDVNDDIRAKMNTIVSEADTYDAENVPPQFVIYDADGNALTDAANPSDMVSFDKAVVGKTYTIKDVSGGLVSKKLSTTANDFGSNAVIDGDSVKITMTLNDLNKVHSVRVITKQDYVIVDSTPIVYVSQTEYAGKDHAQEILCADNGFIDPYSGKISLSAVGFSLSLTKKDADGAIQGDAVSFEGTTYSIRNKATGEEAGVLTVKADGTSNTLQGLAPGTYTYTETNSVDAYVRDTAAHEFTLTDSDYTINAADSIKRGGFTVQKNDSVTGTVPQGDTDFTLTGRVYNRSVNPVIINGTSYAPGAEITELAFQTDAAGYYKSSDILPYGTYEIIEFKAPKGYTGSEIPANTVSQTITIHASGAEPQASLVNKAATGKLTIHKEFLSDPVGGGVASNEQGAEFTALLKSKIKDLNGDGKISVEECRAQAKDQSSFTVNEHSTMTTDADGNAASSELAYGDYAVFQTKAGNAEIKMTDQIIDFQVTEDGQAIKTYHISNVPRPYWLEIDKTDTQTDSAVYYTDAEFKVYQLTDALGNAVNKYVSQKVNDVTYDTFRTVSMTGNDGIAQHTFIMSSDDLTEDGGKVVVPLQLYAGTYRLEEVTVPQGFTKMADKEFRIETNAVSSVDDAGDQIVTVSAENEQITARLSISKSLIDKTADISLINRTDLSGFGFTLTAEEDIINADTGAVITKAGETAKDIYSRTVGQVKTDKSGSAVIEELPLGTYVLKETSQPDGTVTNTAEYHYDLKQKMTGGVLGIGAHPDTDAGDYEKDSLGNPCVSASEAVINDTTMISVSKKAVTGEDELEGATLTVSDKNGKTVDTWISGKAAHMIEGLTAGETYVLSETVTPKAGNGTDLGYAKASSISFKVNDDGTVQKVAMTDKVVTASKEDDGGKEVEGAVITVTDKNGVTVDTWTSTTESHKIKNLEAGGTYTMTETSAPDGYYYSASAVFTVKDDGIDQSEKMIDSLIRYQIAKVDDNGKNVAGVTLKLTDKTAGAEVALPNNGVTTDEPFDLDGVLTAGHSYILEESEYVAGVYQAVNIEFTVPKTGTSEIRTIKMMDETTAVTIKKVDNHGHAVKGAELTILESAKDKDGNVIPAVDKNGKEIIIGTYTSTEDAKGIDVSADVMGGRTYILRESEAPFGFEVSKDIIFTVSGRKDSAQVILMTDVRRNYYVSAVKVDAQDSTKMLAGAELTLFTKDGSAAKDVNGNECRAVTDNSGIITWNVEYNGDVSGYYVQETAAPLGYRINSSHYDVVLSDEYDFAKDSPVKIIVNDEAAPSESVTPDTADKTGPLMLWGIVCAVSVGIIFLTVRRKQERK